MAAKRLKLKAESGLDDVRERVVESSSCQVVGQGLPIAGGKVGPIFETWVMGNWSGISSSRLFPRWTAVVSVSCRDVLEGNPELAKRVG